MTTGSAVCPRCNAIWKPTVADRIAAKSDTPPCFVCQWIQTEEGQRALAAEPLDLDQRVTLGARCDGPGSSTPIGTAPESDEQFPVDPGATVRASA